MRITGYVNGDRKLIHTENAACAPAVTPGKSYDLSVWYKSTGANSLTVFRHSAAGWTYWTDSRPCPARRWTQASRHDPPVPDGTDQISFGISLSANGTLVTDDYAMAPVGPPTAAPDVGADRTTATSSTAATPRPAGSLRDGATRRCRRRHGERHGGSRAYRSR